MSNERENAWHIKREIQVGHIITTLVVAVSVFLYISKLEQRIAILEQAVITQRDRDERQDKLSSEALSQVRNQLDRIEGNVYRLLERAGGVKP